MSHELPPQVPPAMTNGLTTTEQSSSNSLTRDYVSAVADFLETSQDALCACQAFRVALLAYLHNEEAPEATVDAPRCLYCDVLASTLARTITSDPWGYMELAQLCTEGHTLAIVLSRLLPVPPSRSTQ